MTTWYRCTDPDVPGPHQSRWVAYSVRPDLWPPGTYCWSRWAGYPATAKLADWLVRPSLARPDHQYSDPGAAEALILAGQVDFGDIDDSGLWAETPDPQRAG